MTGKSLPPLDIVNRINHAPHVVILGAGASRACCLNGDKSGSKLPLMADYIDVLDLKEEVSNAGFNVNENFEAIYSSAATKGMIDFVEILERRTNEYFSTLELPEQATLYDYLILSLRPKDIIVTFNWDPLLPQAFKRWRHLGPVLPKLAFLHGNVDVCVNTEKKQVRFCSDHPTNNDGFSKSKLLYPVLEKNYTDDPFISHEWQNATTHLRDAYLVTVIGYSAPMSDVEARSLLLEAWRKNPTQTLGEMFLIDVRSEDEVRKDWDDFISGTHSSVSQKYDEGYLMRHPRRTCEAFAFATLQQTPWKEDRLSTGVPFSELEAWFAPLIEEELKGTLSGSPLH
ncbi:hypothetical protein [Parvularcula sp. IMCC14364]|uniref:hypothetical protein n=1 Tax=Parvularcula sp. IMCC14364 TaxID=3067902 RepID=UPI0027422095|nr:hypothetical protein [Parvularcula sp. IMCC14364]